MDTTRAVFPAPASPGRASLPEPGRGDHPKDGGWGSAPASADEKEASSSRDPTHHRSAAVPPGLTGGAGEGGGGTADADPSVAGIRAGLDAGLAAPLGEASGEARLIHTLAILGVLVLAIAWTAATLLVAGGACP